MKSAATWCELISMSRVQGMSAGKTSVLIVKTDFQGNVIFNKQCFANCSFQIFPLNSYRFPIRFIRKTFA